MNGCIEMSPEASGKGRSNVRRRNIGGVLRSLLPRMIGIVLLVFLLKQLDLRYLLDTLKQAHLGTILFAICLLILLIGIKTIRWQVILSALNLSLPWKEAYLAYFASIFIGFLTPGRLGEFGRAFYVHDEVNSRSGMAISSVLADRLFDLYTLLLVGVAAIFSIGTPQYRLWMILFFLLTLLPLILFLNDRTFIWMQNAAGRLGQYGRRLFDPEGWLVGVRHGLLKMGTRAVAVCTGLTIAAYGVYFTQCFLLSKSLALDVNYGVIMFSVALGSLITLLPFSISGLGTREATIVAYMSTVGVAAEKALSFSFLVFVTFYVAGGLVGAIAWLVHPIRLDFKRGATGQD
jgi:uncharacterized protein (TIRG00374 family)